MYAAFTATPTLPSEVSDLLSASRRKRVEYLIERSLSTWKYALAVDVRLPEIVARGVVGVGRVAGDVVVPVAEQVSADRAARKIGRRGGDGGLRVNGGGCGCQQHHGCDPEAAGHGSSSRSVSWVGRGGALAGVSEPLS